MTEYRDAFLEGNERIETAIHQYYDASDEEHLNAVTEAIRQRMREEGHLIFPVFMDAKDRSSFSFRTVYGKDGSVWNVAFTSEKEYAKGAESTILSYFIDRAMQFCLETDTDGFIINPWGQSFLLTKELIETIFEANGDEEYSVPDDPITPELLEDGSYLKRAIQTCNRNRTQYNLVKLTRLFRDSWVWIPCNAVMSDADYEILSRAVNEGGPDSVVGQEFTTRDEIRLIPDILQSGENFFFPVFTSPEEMGEYGEHFSKVQKHFLEAANLAKNNEKDVVGIVINAFTDPFTVPKEMFDIIAEMESELEGKTDHE